MGYAKKEIEEERKISMPKGMREKNACQRAWKKEKKEKKKYIHAERHERKKMHAKEHEEKKRKRKKEIKIAHTFK